MKNPKIARALRHVAQRDRVRLVALLETADQSAHLAIKEARRNPIPLPPARAQRVCALLRLFSLLSEDEKLEHLRNMKRQELHDLRAALLLEMPLLGLNFYMGPPAPPTVSGKLGTPYKLTQYDRAAAYRKDLLDLLNKSKKR